MVLCGSPPDPLLPKNGTSMIVRSTKGTGPHKNTNGPHKNKWTNKANQQIFDLKSLKLNAVLLRNLLTTSKMQSLASLWSWFSRNQLSYLYPKNFFTCIIVYLVNYYPPLVYPITNLYPYKNQNAFCRNNMILRNTFCRIPIAIRYKQLSRSFIFNWRLAVVTIWYSCM